MISSSQRKFERKLQEGLPGVQFPYSYCSGLYMCDLKLWIPGP